MEKLIFVFLLLISTPVFAREYELRYLSEVNGPTCKHVEILDASTGEILEITTEDELLNHPAIEQDALTEVKNIIKDSKASTKEEILEAVEGIK